MPLPLLALAAAGAGPKIGLGIKQLIDAGNLKLQDTTTPEQREMLAIARQRAASGRLPGLGLMQGRLAQAQNAAVQSALLGAGGASDLLAASAAADRTRSLGETQLGLQGEQYNERAQTGLQQQLGLAAQQKQRDLAVYNQQKAALTEGGYRNISNGIDTGASYAAYGMNQNEAKPSGTQGIASNDPASPYFVGPPTPLAAPRTIGIAPLGTRSGYFPALSRPRRGVGLTY